MGDPGVTREAWSGVVEIWRHPGIQRRYGEQVTIGEHMLQAAAGAAEAGDDDALVIAALLHDVGHLTAAADVDHDERNRRHGEIGHSQLAGLLPAAVTEPVRLHIAAKRHLVAVDPGYFARLSPASVHTLRLQGGPFNDDEQTLFLAEPHHRAALRLREWDEDGKIAGLDVAPIEHYRQIIEAMPAP